MQLKFASFFSILVTLLSFTQALEGTAATTKHQVPDTFEEQSFDLSIGVRMKREEESSSSLHKRSEPLSSTEVLLKRDPQTGKFIWPSSFREAVAMAKRDIPLAAQNSLHKRTKLVRRAMRVMITWYTGHDLLKPSCFPDSANWAPTDNSMVAAVTINWPGKPKCGSFVKIYHHTDKNKHIIVRIVDSCAGCKAGTPHIDLTVAAFQKLYNQDVGLVTNLKASIVSPPIKSNHWNEKVIGLYGPRKTL